MYLLIKELEELVAVQNPEPEHFRRLAKAVLELAEAKQKEIDSQGLAGRMRKSE